MGEQEKIELLKVMTGEQNEDVLSAYLTLAGRKVIHTAYPFGGNVAEVPEKYEDIQLNVAAYMLNKRGAEGETAHSEGDVSRSYEDADIPASMLRGIVPMCSLLRSDRQ